MPVEHFKSGPPRAILFDWDNTLVESWGTIHDAMNRTLAAMGAAPWSRNDIETRVRASLRDSFPELFGERWRDAEKIFYEAFGAIHLAHLRPLPGAAELLECAQVSGIYMAIVSNKRGEFLRKEAAHLGWSQYFGVLAGAGDATRDKPAPDHAHLALGLMMPPGKDVWFVGDTDIDLDCAVATGCLPVLLRQQPPGADEFVNNAPALHFQDCAALTAALRRAQTPTSVSA
jgi:phosphoglycolate phosphatase